MDFFEQLKDFLEEHKKLMVALAVLATIGGSLLIPDLCSLLSSQTVFNGQPVKECFEQFFRKLVKCFDYFSIKFGKF